MERERLQQHLSHMSTMWTVFRQAHSPDPGISSSAQIGLLTRYEIPIYRYLLGSVRDPDLADELYQEFALRFVQKSFHRADPQRGRFRDFLKTVLANLIVDHHRKRKRLAAPMCGDVPEREVEDAPCSDDDARFLSLWRGELLDKAWARLASLEEQQGNWLHTVLKYRSKHPDLRSQDMARELEQQIGRPLTPEWVRKRLHLAREKFSDFLLEEVAHSLRSPTGDELEQELLELDLLEHCRPALKRWKGWNGSQPAQGPKNNQ